MTTRLLNWNGEELWTFVATRVAQVKTWAKQHPRIAAGLQRAMTAYRESYCTVETLLDESQQDGDHTRFCFVWSGTRNFVGMCRTEPTTIRGQVMLLLTAVVISESHRGKGVCALLMQISRSRRDKRPMVLYVDKNNTAAIRCYATAGYRVHNKVVHRHPNYMEMQRS